MKIYHPYPHPYHRPNYTYHRPNIIYPSAQQHLPLPQHRIPSAQQHLPPPQYRIPSAQQHFTEDYEDYEDLPPLPSPLPPLPSPLPSAQQQLPPPQYRIPSAHLNIAYHRPNNTYHRPNIVYHRSNNTYHHLNITYHRSNIIHHLLQTEAFIINNGIPAVYIMILQLHVHLITCTPNYTENQQESSNTNQPEYQTILINNKQQCLASELIKDTLIPVNATLNKYQKLKKKALPAKWLSRDSAL